MTTWAYPCYVDDWPEVINMLSKAEPHLRKIGRPEAADLLLRAYSELRDDLLKLNIGAASHGTLVLRRMERTSRVRPDVGSAGHIHGDLNAALFVKRLPDIPGIGIVDLDVLDADVPWWPTNEFGSSANVGRVIRGTFYGGGDPAAPSNSRFREHALFNPGSSMKPSGKGTIRRPIPERRFIRESIKVIDAEWKAELDKIKGRYMQRLDLCLRTYQ